MLVYFVAGLVKGVVGFGMPLVSLALLATVLGLADAIILMVVPSLVTNLWQGLFGGHLIALLRRLWSLLLPLCVVTWFASGVLVRSQGPALTIALGGLLVVYSFYSLARRQVRPPGRHETWISPLVGMATGISIGLTGTFVVPGILYLQALQLGKDALVQAMGLGFIVASAAIGLSLAVRDTLPTGMLVLSLIAVAPVVVGMLIGQRLRTGLPEEGFRRVFFLTLALLGTWLVLRPLFHGV